MGTLIDNGSTDDYILTKTAERMKLKGQPVQLITEGFGGVTTNIQTKLYYVPIIDRCGRTHYLPCYGTDKITADSNLPDAASYQRMCRKFGVDPGEVRRPSRIELLISLRSGHLHPNDAGPTIIGDMKLASGPLGRVFGGSDPELKFSSMKMATPLMAAQLDTSIPLHSKCMKAVVREAVYSTPMRTDREILNFFDEEQIGIHFEPRCGDCRCGSCTLGSKQMSLKEEREYDHFKSLMFLDEQGTHDDPGPYWRTEFPWTIEPDDLIDNKAAVTAVMHATEKKLSKNPAWRETYEKQLRELVDKKFASEITLTDIARWINEGGKTYYIAHQMVVNPQNKSTPVRCCFNSSQKYKGFSLNSSWELGPDLVNSLHGVLLRFRKDLVGAQGDITKMYYMVRIKEKESWMQIFMWKFVGETVVRYFKMERLVMGNKPSASLSGVSLAETARLHDFPTRYPAAFTALTKDAYVDNIFLTAPDHDSLKAMIEEIEHVAAKGGFFFKPFVTSGERVPDIIIGAPVHDNLETTEEKALGVYWDVTRDTLYIKADLEKLSKRYKRGIPLTTVSIGPNSMITISPRMTLRACLSLHARPFDALGFILPTRVIGNILFRNTLQIMKKDKKGKIPWDDEIVEELQGAWNEYLGMLLYLDTIQFPRSVKPAGTDPEVKPMLCTFNDGNPDAFGTVGYVRWIMNDGSAQCRLLLSKSRLGPLMHKGETVRNELSGATLSARLTHWTRKNSGIEFDCHHHFLDSQIVKDMLGKESYGFNTFFGLRVAEVQQKTNYHDWKHIPSKSNIADLLTKGVAPSMLGPDSEWQNGPIWLRKDESMWPVTVQPLRKTSSARDALEPFFRKTSKTHYQNSSSLDSLDILISRCGSLQKLLRCLSYILRWRLPARSVQKGADSNGDIQPADLVSFVRPVTTSEMNDAMNLIVVWEQSKLTNIQTLKLATKTVYKDLINLDRKVAHIVIGGRVKNFPVSFSGHSNDVPVLPYGGLAKLVVEHYHNKYHREVDTIVSYVRNDYWVIKCRKIASSVDNKCRDCKIERNKRSTQVMGDLPLYRSTIQPAFSVVGCDLWGPVIIKDDVVKRGNKVTKKAWGVLFSCAATRAIYLDVACGASTEELLHVLRRAIARCGQIKTIITDPGTNFIGAANELRAWRQGWDQDTLTRFGSERGIEWITIMANSQHQNGFTEIMVKLTKSFLKSLMKSIGQQILTLNEINTLLAETSQLVNDRPIGLKPNKDVDSGFLSPNSLLIGRNAERISSGPFRPNVEEYLDNASFRNRFQLVQMITDQFWRIWTKLHFPSLVVRQKWHSEKRNLQIGDICVIQDSNNLRGEWRLAQVTCSYPDCHGRVRNVELMVKPRQGGNGPYISTRPVYVKRHVKNVVVIEPVDQESSGSDVVLQPKN